MTYDIILANEGIIYKVINKYCYYFDRDDLYQVAVIGLLNAFNNYKSSFNTKFSSYAYFYILGEVKKYIRESNYFKVSREFVKLNSSINRAVDYLTNKYGKVPSDSDVSSFLGISLTDIEDARMANYLVTSIDSDEGELSISDTIGDTPLEYNPDILDLKCEVDKLDDQSKRIVIERYKNGLTQSEVSSLLGISQVQVSRKEKDILVRLRRDLS